MDAFYWSRAAARAYSAQGLSLDLARLNPRGSQARKAWLESAAMDASRKRMYRRFHMRDLGAFFGDEYGLAIEAVA